MSNKQYKVIALSFSGIGKRVLKYGEIITVKEIPAGQFEMRLEGGFIEEVKSSDSTDIPVKDLTPIIEKSTDVNYLISLQNSDPRSGVQKAVGIRLKYLKDLEQLLESINKSTDVDFLQKLKETDTREEIQTAVESRVLELEESPSDSPTE